MVKLASYKELWEQGLCLSQIYQNGLKYGVNSQQMQYRNY
jgi:hypothetical protein